MYNYVHANVTCYLAHHSMLPEVTVVRWLSKKMGTKRTKAPIFFCELLWYLAFILRGVPPLNVIKSGITH